MAVQGIGHVGYYLCKHLHEAGAKLIVTDIDQESVNRAVQEFGAQAVEPDAIYDVECDIFAPCALGAVVNDNTINRFLSARPLPDAPTTCWLKTATATSCTGAVFSMLPITSSMPGGLMNVADELKGYNEERAIATVKTIYNNIAKVYEIAKRDNIPTYKACRHAWPKSASRRSGASAPTSSAVSRAGESCGCQSTAFPL